jgi:tRNA threonylcarbamoyl adenosine modification protein YeaZ
MYLAIDTSSETTGLALIRDGQILAGTTWHCDRNHTGELLPHLEEMLKKTALNIKDIKGIIVARGPGSFNGLRVGLGTAKGLAFSLNVPIVGIGTLEAAAYQFADSGLPACAVFTAGRGEISCAGDYVSCNCIGNTRRKQTGTGALRRYRHAATHLPPAPPYQPA